MNEWFEIQQALLATNKYMYIDMYVYIYVDILDSAALATTRLYTVFHFLIIWVVLQGTCNKWKIFKKCCTKTKFLKMLHKN